MLAAGHGLAQEEPDPGAVGEWGVPFTHDTTGFNPQPPFDPSRPNARFNAIHMALIPAGDKRGQVIVWDNHWSNPPQSKQRWSIVDPSTQTMLNYELPMPSGMGDLFCAGLAWTPEGFLLVAGGTTQYGDAQGLPYKGGRLVYLWNPVNWNNSTADNGWYRQSSDLAVDRWYATVTLDSSGEPRLIVSGGTPDQSQPDHNHYEAYRVTDASQHLTAFDKDQNNVRLYAGPDGQNGSKLGQYPRLHLISTGEIFLSGHGNDSAKVLHDPNVTSPTWNYWAGDKQASSPHRHDGMHVLFPLDLSDPLNPFYDHVMRIGGSDGTSVHKSVEYAFARPQASPGSQWASLPDLAIERVEANSVLLPDLTVLVVGGQKNPLGTSPLVPVNTPELYKGGSWQQMAVAASVRDYHSTEVLLPDGRVFCAGGDRRDWDYEIYSPPYLFAGERPANASAPGQVGYNSLVTVTHDALQTVVPPTFVERVVLIAPGAVTHHSCMSTRAISCWVESRTSTTVTFATPPSAGYAPKGYYMLFLVTNHGVPSVATWTRLQ